MERQWIGKIAEIARYPVKSMAGETLSEAQIAAYGVYGDRSHAFVEEGVEGWERYVTARDIPQLLTYRASFEAEDSERDDQFPPIVITGPDGRTYSWNEHLRRHVQPLSRRPLTLLDCRPDDKELAVDAGGILIITDRTLRMLERLLGHSVDLRRFRANLVLALREDVVGDDAELLGRTLHVGEAELAIEEPCERCMMITIDPDTLERDPRILRQVNEELGLQFGVYASVKRTGKVRTGDNVYVTSR